MERLVKSADGAITLHVLDQGPPQAAMTVLCLHGFTRNGMDFDPLSAHLADRYRIIVPDQRGRGRSTWDNDPANYQPVTYVADMFALLDELGIARAVVIGTSMGGIMAMIMATMQPERLQGVVLNDIGTEIPLRGMQRLHAMLGDRSHPASWAEAAIKAREAHAPEFPDYGDADWQAFARRLYREEDGVPGRGYDPAILAGLDDTDPTAPAPDLWALWPALQPIPVLAIRGALSEILSAETLAAMHERHPRLTAVTVPERGHAPMLDEPEAIAAIETFLAGLRNADPIPVPQS